MSRTKSLKITGSSSFAKPSLPRASEQGVSKYHEWRWIKDQHQKDTARTLWTRRTNRNSRCPRWVYPVRPSNPAPTSSRMPNEMLTSRHEPPWRFGVRRLHCPATCSSRTSHDLYKAVACLPPLVENRSTMSSIWAVVGVHHGDEHREDQGLNEYPPCCSHSSSLSPPYLTGAGSGRVQQHHENSPIYPSPVITANNSYQVPLVKLLGRNDDHDSILARTTFLHATFGLHQFAEYLGRQLCRRIHLHTTEGTVGAPIISPYVSVQRCNTFCMEHLDGRHGVGMRCCHSSRTIA